MDGTILGVLSWNQLEGLLLGTLEFVLDSSCDLDKTLASIFCCSNAKALDRWGLSFCRVNFGVDQYSSLSKKAARPIWR